MNSNSIESYNSLGVNQSTSVNAGISSASSSSSSTPVSSSTASGNMNVQNLSPSNIVPAISTTPNNTNASSSSSAAAASNASNLTILQQRSSNLPLTNTVNNSWSNANTANAADYANVDDY